MLQVLRDISDRLVWIVCIIMLFVLRKQRSRAAMLKTTPGQSQGVKHPQ
jgi:hypothetical protein